jgi:hypothetical protein
VRMGTKLQNPPNLPRRRYPLIPLSYAPNKPNLPGGAGGVGRGMLYKQSQFPPDQKEGQVLGGKRLMAN